MKVLILTRHYFPIDRPSGVVSLIREFIRSAVAQGHNVQVGCLKQEGERDLYVDQDEVTVLKLNAIPIARLRKTISKFSPDQIVIFSSISSGITLLIWWYSLMLFTRALTKTTFYQTTNLSLNSLQRPVFRYLVNKFNQVKASNKDIIDEMGVAFESDMVVVPGLDRNALLARAGNSPKNECFSVCFMGHLSMIKGADLVIDVAEELPETQFVLIAGRSIGAKNIEFYDCITNRIADISNIEHIPFCEDPIAQLNKTNLLLLPYRSAITVLGVAQSAIEAMALGIPVISTRNESVSELIENGYNGFFAESISDFKAIISRIEADPELYKQLSINAVTTVVNRFSIADQTTRILLTRE